MRSKSLASKIKVQSIRMAVVYTALVGLTAWQWHFVWEGVNHNIYLNAMIFLVFLFGAALAAVDLRGMTNERLAFEALQEAYSDIQMGRIKGKEDPFWRHYRCLEKGTVFTPPKLLGHLYELIVEELHRTKQMQISVATMQNLIAAIQHSNHQSRSLLQYMSGLLVFLGLIGTFIGLMEMVSSVGGIIGGLANSEASGDAVKNLLGALQAPLTGMATGFAASLFGLFTSLVLGLVNRFVSSAAHAIEAEFEAWLAGISQLENEKKSSGEGRGGEGGAGGGSGSVEGVAPGDATFMAAPGVAAMITAMRSTNHTFEKTADAIMKLADKRKEENDTLMATLAQMERLTAEQDSMRRAITALGSIRDDISGLRQLDYAQANRMVEGFSKIEHTLEESRIATSKGFEAMALQELEARKQARVETDLVLSKIDETKDEAIKQHLSTTDRLESLVQLQASLSRLLQTTQDQTVDKIEDMQGSMSEIRAAHADLVQSLEHVRGDVTSGIKELLNRPDTSPQIQQMSVSMDSTLVKGLGEVAQVLNTALAIMTSSMKDIAAKQADTAQALNVISDTKELTTEIRSLGRSIDSGLSTGFAEMSRSFESIFLSYSELVQRMGTGGPAASAGAPAPHMFQAPAAPSERVAVPVVDPVRQEQAREADAKKPTNEMTARQRIEHMEKLYESAKVRINDLLKSA
ncbi:MAG TPA: MotA/TolQ/ExbB proton channel family protein [Beijerinckiaceae bacterium]|nr:MotA/TolQ/ExbB proton channel family protein [Beijerinckiaceae bacterium]